MIDTLPHELILLIIEFLDMRSRRALGFVNRHLYNTLNSADVLRLVMREQKMESFMSFYNFIDKCSIEHVLSILINYDKPDSHMSTFIVIRTRPHSDPLPIEDVSVIPPVTCSTIIGAFLVMNRWFKTHTPWEPVRELCKLCIACGDPNSAITLVSSGILIRDLRLAKRISVRATPRVIGGRHVIRT